MIKPSSNRRRTMFGFACATSFLLYFHRYTWNIVRPQLQSEYGFDNTELSYLDFAFYLSYAVGQIPSGIVSDLFGTHLFLVVIILAWSLALPLHGLTGNLFGSMGIRLLFGAGQAGAYPALSQVTRSWFPVATRTQMQGWVASFFGRGGGAASSLVMATMLMGWCGLSWRTALYLMVLPGILLALSLWLFFRTSPAEDDKCDEAERALISGDEPISVGDRDVIPMSTALTNVSLQLLVVQQFLNAGADVVYTVILGSFFASLGVGTEQLGGLLTIVLIGGALGGVAGGFLNDLAIRVTGSSRWGRPLVASTGKCVAAGILLVAIQQSSPIAIAAGLFCVKFFTDWTQPSVWGACTDLGGKYSATVFSINNTSGNVGALVTPLVIGRLLDWFSVTEVVNGESVQVTNFTPMFVLVAGMYVGCAVVWLFIDSTKQIKRDKPATSGAG